MLFSYGDGEFIESDIHCQGEILLSEFKLYLRGNDGDLTQSFVPLDKIKSVKLTSGGLIIFVRLSVSTQFHALIKGDRKRISELCNDIVKARGLKKKFLAKEWIEDIK